MKICFSTENVVTSVASYLNKQTCDSLRLKHITLVFDLMLGTVTDLGFSETVAWAPCWTVGHHLISFRG